MEIKQLRYFLAVAENLNFTQAAQQLHITQPSLSQQIREFETELGLQLFERDKKHVSLTEAGQVLREEAYVILSHSEHALQRLASYQSGTTGTISIGTLNFFEVKVLPELSMQLRKNSPNIQISWHQHTLSELLKQLQTGNIDVSVVILPLRHQIPQTKKIIINYDELVFVYPKTLVPETNLALQEESLRRILSQPYFQWSEWYTEHTQQLLDELLRLQPRLNIMPTRNINSCIMNILVENGFTILPKQIILDLNQPQITYSPLPFPKNQLEIAMLYNANNSNTCISHFLETARTFEKIQDPL